MALRIDTNERTLSGDPADAPSLSAPVALTPEDRELQEYAENQAKEMDALAATIASMIDDLPNDPELDSHRAELAALKSSVTRAAASLRSGGASMMAIGGMTAAAAQAWAAAKNIDREAEQQSLEEGSEGVGITASSSAIAAANDNFLRFSGAHAQRLQDKIDAAGTDHAQGVVTLDIMKSQASQLIWDNRHLVAEQSGYALGSQEYQQFMSQTAEAALLTARGEQREQIIAQLARENGLEPGTAAYDQFVKPYMDRTVDDKNYQNHYDTAKAALLAEYPGITEAELKAIESDPKYEGKSFMVMLKENPDAANKLIQDMNAKYNGGEQLTDKQLASLSPDERAAYIKANLLQNAQESMFVQNEKLQQEQQRFEEVRLTIDEKVKTGEYTHEQAVAMKEQAFKLSMERREGILNHHLTPGEVEEQMDKSRDDTLSIKTQQMINGGRKKEHKGHQPALEGQELISEAEQGQEASRIAFEMEEHKVHLAKEGLIAPEGAKLATKDDIYKGILAKYDFGGTSLVAAANANERHVDHGQLNELAQSVPMAGGHELVKAATAEQGAGRSHKQG